MKFIAQTTDSLRVEGYRDGGFIVAETLWSDGVLVTPGAAFGFSSLDLRQFDPLNQLDPLVELLLIGTGAAMRRPPADLLAALAARGLATEFMASRAAARTYNVLLAEGRLVAAALLPDRP